MKPLYMFWGKVINGKNRGKNLGFPTANISLHKNIPEGIYVSEVKLVNKTYSTVTFIGSAKTFGEKEYKAESYILNFDKKIYGKWITVRLLKKIRGNKKFISEEKLIEQMKLDVLATRKFFNKSS